MSSEAAVTRTEPRSHTRSQGESLLARLVLLPVRLWQWMAPMRTPRCKFYPSCSAYAVEAVSKYGVLRGGWLAIRRLGRCHPWSVGGVDHVK
jgi:uncharacterized protein